MQINTKSIAKSSVARSPVTAPSPPTPVDMATAANDRIDYSLAGQIGGELSGQVSVMQEIVQEFNSTRRISRNQMQALIDAIEAAGVVARQSQQISRIAEGRVRQSHERLRLHEIVNKSLDERLERLKKRGTEIYRNIKPVEIIVDPGLLSLLVDTAIDWAAQFGQRLTVSLGIKNWPENGLLVIKASQSVVDTEFEEAPAKGDNLHWALLVQVGRAMGVTVERDMAGGEAKVVAEFARTVKQLEGLTTVELDGGGDSSHHSATKPLAGLRILLATTDPMVRAEVHKTCSMLGLLIDTVPTADKAVRYVETDMPHMIIIDERIRDEAFDALIDDMRRLDPNFGFLEIAEGSNTFEMSSWMTDSMTRISRDVLRDQLASLLTLELAKAL